MSSEEKKIVDFVLHLRSDTNPYAAIARYLKGVMAVRNSQPSTDLSRKTNEHSQTFQPPQLAGWATIAQRCALGLFIIAFDLRAGQILQVAVSYRSSLQQTHNAPALQSVCTRSTLRAAAAPHMRYIVSVRCPYRNTDAAGLDTVAITDLFLLDQANAGERDLSGEIMLFGIKYIPILLNGWFFLWVCACQCASLVCESGLGEVSGMGGRLHPAIRVVMHAILLAVLIIPIPIVFYCYTKVNKEYVMAKSILHGVLQALDAKEVTATPQNYNRMELLAILKPARDMQPHAHNMAVLTRSGIMIYLVQLTTLSVVYVPLLAVSLGRLYARSVSQKKLDMAASGGEANGKISKMGRKIREQRRRLVTHAMILYVTVVLHVPILIAQLAYEGDGFLRNQGWLTLTRVGLTLPFAIGGNGIAFILNVHARNQLADTQTQNPAATTMTSTSEAMKTKETFMPKFNPGGKDVELSLLPTYVGLNGRDAQLNTIETREAPFGSAGVRSHPSVVPLHASKPSRKQSSKSVVSKSSIHFKQSYDRQTEQSGISAEDYPTKY
ncbi:uncharacterized protein MELLADRAFT_113621 [Melampsora larici-populina 98AG31]|uniref:Uncharacterized protein n=1 Tax=Melampsora larici-populina (strain 98AG31 / pathotype 3-4-7) TaxID=747676 RepID=F4SAI1_MELLP|nr:uncharacterized protein MELLADRAFT_113621 [Melampsora larici-populina 98AG31]EGF98331.1 hypothetical protein MELLADRAFT_113621 [Melampsora larici-populina 98AG31]